MTNEQINERIAKLCGKNEMVGLKKRGLWYRPGASGYTSCECDAGRFTREEAKKHEYLKDEPVTIHEFSPRDYACSLDACSEFERFSSSEDWNSYFEQLMWVCERDETEPMIALAIQRCEAFLRMKGQWDEN